MRRVLASFPAFAAVATLIAGPAEAQFHSLETDHLRLIYIDVTQSYLAPHVARCFENALEFDQQLFGYRPSERVSVVLDDLSDYHNGRASAAPRNVIGVSIAPSNWVYETVPGNERMNSTMNHELVHVVMLDRPGRMERRFRGLFGGKPSISAAHPETVLFSYLTTPRRSAPRWYHEGIATFIETWMAGGIGRAQGAYDEMVFRSMVADGSRFYDPLGLVSEGTKVDFQVEANAYLYGTRFMSYLAQAYSPAKVIQWVTRTDDSRAYYAAQFERAFGKPLGDAWQDWIAWEGEFQTGNLAAIREFPTTPYRDLSPQALGSVSRAFLDPEARTLYTALNYPGAVAHIGAISLDDGSVAKLREVKGPSIYNVTSLAFDPATKTLFYTADNDAHRDLMAIDADGGHARQLIKDGRVGDIVFDASGRALWGVRHLNGISTLVRIPHPYADWNRVRSWPYGQEIYDLDVSPDGKFLSASLGEPSGHHSLRVFAVDDLLAGGDEPTAIATADFGQTIPSNFVFSGDGRFLYGTSYYTGVSNVFRYEIGTGELTASSNAETGFFRPIPREDGTFIVFRYTGTGFVPAVIEPKPLEDLNPIVLLGQRLAEEHPVLDRWNVGSPDAIDIEAKTRRSGDYQPLRSIGLESIFPIVQGYKDSVAYGLRLGVSDPLQLHRATLTASYSPDGDLAVSERLHLDARYERGSWTLFYQHNGADFYDLFGPTKRSRKGYVTGVDYRRTLIDDRPRKLELVADAAYYGGLERLPDYQNVSSSFAELVAASVGLRYRNLRASLGAVDYEKGYSWDLSLADSHVNGVSFPSLDGGFDIGAPLPFGHSSIWLRTAAGFSPGDPDEPFANFFFGGFGNNWVDRAASQRYRERYALPGLELNQVGGRNFVKGLVELQLPPVRFRRLGTPGFYVTWARPSVFVSTLATDLDRAEARTGVHDAGVQVDLRFTWLSNLDMTLSAGYAVALERGERPRDEFMLSLKVLR